MSTEYPLTPFGDFLGLEFFPGARREEGVEPTHGFEDYVGEGWGPGLQPERREDRVPAAGNYEGMGEDNPYAT